MGLGVARSSRARRTRRTTTSSPSPAATSSVQWSGTTGRRQLDRRSEDGHNALVARGHQLPERVQWKVSAVSGSIRVGDLIDVAGPGSSTTTRRGAAAVAPSELKVDGSNADERRRDRAVRRQAPRGRRGDVIASVRVSGARPQRRLCGATGGVAATPTAVSRPTVSHECSGPPRQAPTITSLRDRGDERPERMSRQRLPRARYTARNGERRADREVRRVKKKKKKALRGSAAARPRDRVFGDGGEGPGRDEPRHRSGDILVGGRLATTPRSARASTLPAELTRRCEH